MSSCYLHPAIPSVHACSNCLKPLCGGCLSFQGDRELCPPCLKMISGSGRTRAIVIAVLGLAVAAGVGGFAYRASQTPKPPPPASRVAPPPLTMGEQWKARLEKEPCDKELVSRASRELLKDNAARDAVGVIDRYNEKCPPLPRLLWTKYSAHEQLGEHELAAAAAGKLIDDNPDDQDFWWWRGKSYLAAKKYAEAERDLVQALTILPGANHVPFDLADTYEKQKRPCDAFRVLEDHRGYHPYQGSYPLLEARLERLQKEGACESTMGEGKPVTLRFPPGGNVIPVRVKFEGVEGKKEEALLLLDTGASMVTISRRLATKLGIREGEKTLTMLTANGRTRMQLAMVEAIDVRGAVAKSVPVAIADDLGDKKMDGLLGMGFLGRFDLRVMPKQGKLEIVPREVAKK